MLEKIERLILEAFPDVQLRDGKPFRDLFQKASAVINENYEAEKNNFLNKFSLENFNSMTENELDAITSNFIYSKRRSGRYSTGVVRVFLSQRTDIVFDKSVANFKSVSGIKFIPRYDFSIKANNLSFDFTSNKYYVDIPVI